MQFDIVLDSGRLGFVKFGDRQWLPEELKALQAIATLFAQLQARTVAEERVLYLADHDLTGLLNRRAADRPPRRTPGSGSTGPSRGVVPVSRSSTSTSVRTPATDSLAA
jgi:diguanylate cyclase